MTSSEPSRATGRPRAAEAALVAAVGLRLFAERGFESVTMTDIADASGIGRTTLLRYFPSKADIVWDHSSDEVEMLRSILAASDRTGRTIDILCDAMPRIFAYPDGDLDLLRTQVSIISGSAGGWTGSQARFQSWESAIRDFIFEHTAQPRNSLYSRALTRCIAETGRMALSAWIETDEERPDEHLIRAYRYLREGFTLPAAPHQTSAE